MSIRTEKVQIPVKGTEKPMPAYLAIPDSPGPHGAVIVIEEIFGVNGHIRDVTERLAREGYVAIAPDIHHRAAPSAWWELPYNEEGMKKGMELLPKLSADGIKADVEGTLAFLRGRSDVKRERIGIMGFCIGGHVAYLAACTTDVKAAASFYGGGVATFSPGGGPPTVSKSGGIKGRIICFFGGKDPMITADQVETIRKELEKQHVRHEVLVYPDTTHGFFRDPDPRVFNEKARDDAWARTKKLFAEELR